MNIKNIFDIIDKKIRLTYNSRAELANKMGIRKQEISRILLRLEKGQNISFDKLENLCEFLGYEIVIQKKKKAK